MVKLRVMLEVLQSPPDFVTPSPFDGLVPVSPQTSVRHQFSEFFTWDSRVYRLWQSTSSEGSESLLWKTPHERVLQHVIAEYDWQNCLHPLDLENWVAVFKFFAWGDLFQSQLFNASEESLQKQWEMVKSLDQDERNLMCSGRMDPRLCAFLKSRGFKMNGFFHWCFKSMKLSYNSQIEVVDRFSRFFRREGINAEDYLLENHEILERKAQSRQQFMVFMSQLTSPRYHEFKEKKLALSHGLVLPATMNATMDDTLEEDWVELNIKVESLGELSAVADSLNDPKNKKVFTELFGEDLREEF